MEAETVSHKRLIELSFWVMVPEEIVTSLQSADALSRMVLVAAILTAHAGNGEAFTVNLTEMPSPGGENG